MKAEPKKEETAKIRKPFRDADGSIFKKTVERRTHTGRKKKVTIFISRVRYTDLEGNRREKKRIADSYNEAIDRRRELHEEIARELNPALNAPEQPKIFNELADYYEKEYVKLPVFRKDQIVEGVRENLEDVRRNVRLFREFFGKKLLKNISYEDLREFKKKRLATPVIIVKKFKIPLTDEEKRALKKINPKNRTRFRTEKREVKSERALATVHRELSRLKRMFSIAVRKDWLQENPFKRGEPLINIAAETVRVRILSREEEIRLLQVAEEGRSPLLKEIIVFAIDTFMRRGEIFKLTWKMIDLDNRRINLPAKITKTLKARTVFMSARVFDILKKLHSQGSGKGSVFGYQSDASTAFDNAREKIGANDLRFHDLRATGITRLLRAGFSESEIMKISGHSDPKTFQKYVRTDDDTFARAATAMDKYYDDLN